MALEAMRKILVKIKGKTSVAFVISFLLLIILVAYLAVPRYYSEIETYPNLMPYDMAPYELTLREKLRWNQLKVSERQFKTDAEIDKEIVYGKSYGGWNTDLGTEFEWSVAPTAAGGTISFQQGDKVALIRIPATLNEPAKWFKLESQ